MSRSRHNVARAVLISADRYRDLVGRDASVLESLRGQLVPILKLSFLRKHSSASSISAG